MDALPLEPWGRIVALAIAVVSSRCWPIASAARGLSPERHSTLLGAMGAAATRGALAAAGRCGALAACGVPGLAAVEHVSGVLTISFRSPTRTARDAIAILVTRRLGPFDLHRRGLIARRHHAGALPGSCRDRPDRQRSPSRSLRRDRRQHDADVAALRPMAQHVVHQHQRQHRLGDRRRADADAGVVAAEASRPSSPCLRGRSSGAALRIELVGLIAMRDA